MDIRYFDTLDSTNNYCKLLDPNSVGEFTVICARNQTAGIGQKGNRWVSEPYKNLTFSIILKPTSLPASRQFILTMALSIAVAETVDATLSAHHTPFPVHIKWPNDIYVGDRKICGILVTNSLSGDILSQSICGIGLNVNQRDFPDWVPNPTSLSLLLDRDNLDLDSLLRSLLDNFQRRYLQMTDKSEEMRQKYLSLLYRLGTPANYIVHGHPVRATITGVDPIGRLLLSDNDGTAIACGMKEVQFVI